MSNCTTNEPNREARLHCYGYAAAATLVMLGLTAIVVLLQLRIVRRWTSIYRL